MRNPSEPPTKHWTYEMVAPNTCSPGTNMLVWRYEFDTKVRDCMWDAAAVLGELLKILLKRLQTQ